MVSQPTERVTNEEWWKNGTNWQDKNMGLAPTDRLRRQALKRQARTTRVNEARQIQGELTLWQAWVRLPFETRAGVVFFTLVAAMVIALFVTG